MRGMSIYSGFLILMFTLSINSKEIIIEAGPNAHERLQEAMILMKDGDTLIIDSGNYIFEDSLSLDVNNVTIKGKGMNKTILNFKDKKSGAQGLLVTSDKVTL